MIYPRMIAKPTKPLPPQLRDLARAALAHSDVVTTGITVTTDGRWALRLSYRYGHPLSDFDVARLGGEFPVIIEEEPQNLPRAESVEEQQNDAQNGS